MRDRDANDAAREEAGKAARRRAALATRRVLEAQMVEHEVSAGGHFGAAACKFPFLRGDADEPLPLLGSYALFSPSQYATLLEDEMTGRERSINQPLLLQATRVHVKA